MLKQSINRISHGKSPYLCFDSLAIFLSTVPICLRRIFVSYDNFKLVEQLPGFKAGDIAAFAITTPGGDETPAVLVQCRTSDEIERLRLRDEIREKVRAITGMNCVIELVPPRTLPR